METVMNGASLTVQSSGSSARSEEVMHSVSDEELDMQLELRRGPWTAEEDHLLIHFVNKHGEGRWNSLARAAGLKRTGKSCRLRWLNYLRPDVRRGNITPQEQLLILHLHSRWGNRWSKIAQYLPGRTDNEIKNYWRTRVQKHAKQLQCDVNSKKFRDVMHYIWMPHLLQRIQAAASTTSVINTPSYDEHQKPRQDMMMMLDTANIGDESNSQLQIISSPSKSDCFTNSINSTITAQDHHAEFSSSDMFQCPNPWAGFANSDDPIGLLDSQQCVNWGVDFMDNMWSLDDILSVQ